MKELDVAMIAYLEKFYSDASPADQQAFEDLIDMQDPKLFALITEKEHTDDESIERVLQVLRRAVTA